EDNFTIWMNAVLLFVVLFYVYPLKFVFTLVVRNAVDHDLSVETAHGRVQAAAGSDMPKLMAIFGAGYVAVFSVFLLLYWYAYRKRRELELTDLEAFDTREKIQEHVINVAIGLLSITIALKAPLQLVGLSGMVYFLLGPVHTINGWLMGRRRRRFEQ